MNDRVPPFPSLVIILYLFIAGGGLFGLPALLAPTARPVGPSGAPGSSAVIWLVGAAVLVILGVWLAPGLFRIVRSAVRGTPWFKTEGPHAVPNATSGWISFPVVAIVNLALAESILRPALVAVLGGPISSSATDALVAVCCLILLLLLLVRLNATAGPWVEAGAWYTLDVLVATANSEGARRFYDTGQHRTRAVITQRDGGTGFDRTRTAPAAEATGFAGDATVAAPAAANLAETIAAPAASGSETLLADRPADPGER